MPKTDFQAAFSIASGLMTSAYMVEITLAIYFVGFAIGFILWGIISDFSGRKRAMLMGLLVYGIATVGCANFGSIEALLIGRFFQAFGASVGSVITQTIVRDSYEGAKRTKLFSIMSGALAFSPAIGPLLRGFISEFLGWRANFWSLALLSVILFFWTLFSLKETRPKHLPRLSIDSFCSLFFAMMMSRQLWGHILLIAGATSILFGFYQEAPFVFIEQLGVQPKFYGCFGLLIAAATILAARISYRQSSHFSAEAIIQWGSACVLMGGVMFTLTALAGLFTLDIGVALAVLNLFLVFFGIGLIIPNSLSLALKPYQSAAGTISSIFGGCYYCLTAGCTWFMSLLHNGSALPLPLYMTLLGSAIVFGAQMIQQHQSEEQKAKG